MQDEPILAATDLSDRAQPALRTAARLAKRRGVSLTVFNALEWAADLPTWQEAFSDQTRAEYCEHGRRKLEEYFERTVPANDQPKNVHFRVEIEFPEVAITEALAEGEHGLVVLGATGIGRVASLFLGSVPEDVVRRSSEPVLVIPRDAEPETFEHVLAPVDFSDCSRESLSVAIDFAREHDATLTILHAVPLMGDVQATPVPNSVQEGTMEDFKSHRSDQFEKLLAEAPLDGLEWNHHQEMGSPDDVIREAVVDFDIDLIAMGTHGRRGFQRLVLGSTAAKILRTMPCSVLTVRSED